MEICITTDKDPFTIALLSDTHVTGKAQHLPAGFLRRMSDGNPDLILHCGDVCSAKVLDELRKIAPVYAVRGNRDFAHWTRLPPFIDIDLNGVRIHAEHGQGNPFEYIRAKAYFTFQNIRGKPIDPGRVVTIREDFSRYDLYFFGHSHMRQVYRNGNTVFVNPGHINVADPGDPEKPPSFAMVRVTRDNISVAISVYLHGKFSETDYNYTR